MSTLWAIAGTVLALLSLPGTVELILLTLGGVLPPRRRPESDSEAPRIAVVVPAHNEEAGIEACLASLRRCEGAFEIVVIADNCSDATAKRAAAAGVRVLQRNDPERRGKGYALDYAFRTLLPEGFDALLVIDADTRVEPNLIKQSALCFQAGADAVQCRYRVGNPDASLRTRLMNVALLAFNVLRPRGRERWGLSVGLLGNGFGLSRGTLEALPCDAASIAEDLEYHLRLVRDGRRVRFIDAATVYSDMPSGGRVAGTQRTRWEGGRFRMLADWGPTLAKEILQGRLNRLEPLLDLLLLPLAFHVLLVLAALLPPFGPSRGYALFGLAVVVLHVIAAIRVGQGGWQDYLGLAAAPFYVLWKLTLFKAYARSTRKDAEWVRTDRGEHDGR